METIVRASEELDKERPTQCLSHEARRVDVFGDDVLRHALGCQEARHRAHCHRSQELHAAQSLYAPTDQEAVPREEGRREERPLQAEHRDRPLRGPEEVRPSPL